MAEARDFHCCSHVFENLGNRSIPSDHAAVRLVIQKPCNVNAFQTGCSNIPFFALFCSGFTTTTDTLLIHLVHLLSSKLFLKRRKRQTVRELSQKTLDSMGAKLSIASTALRACRSRHLGTLMRCCEAWQPIEHCFDPISFDCIDFQRLGQIIANLTR